MATSNTKEPADKPETQHTPGPLVVEEILNMPGITHGVREVDGARPAGGFWTAYITTDLVDGTAEGNARLYAAAPDLLESAQKLLGAFASGHHSFYDHRNALEAAVLKATGEEGN